MKKKKLKEASVCWEQCHLKALCAGDECVGGASPLALVGRGRHGQSHSTAHGTCEKTGEQCLQIAHTSGRVTRVLKSHSEEEGTDVISLFLGL